MRRSPFGLAAVRPALPLALPLGVLCLAACGTDRPPRVNDTAVVVTAAEPPPTPPARVSMNGWSIADAGRLLVVPTAGSALRAQLVYPQFTDSTLTAAASFDMAAADGMKVELFSPAGLVGAATLNGPVPGIPPAHQSRGGAGRDGRAADSAGGGAAGCTAWPAARVSPEVEPITPWTVAFAAGHATALPLDSIAGLSAADSARLAAEVARVASTIPQDTASAFRGLPFVVRNVRLFSPDSGVQAFVATVTRRVNQEASQQVEQLLLVAERPASSRLAGGFREVYAERVTGEEETMELSDVLAAVHLGPPGRAGRATLVVGRDYGDGSSYTLLERAPGGGWRVRWSSAYAGC